MPDRTPRVVRAELILAPGTDLRAPGGAVTLALCGAYEHEPPCRWPNNNDIDVARTPAMFSTIFAGPDHEADEVQRRIIDALRASTEWTVVSADLGTLTDDERELGERLARV